jgi:hypothetical protein
LSSTTLELLGLPEATKDYVTVLINKDVFRFEVTMDDTGCVQGLNTLNDFCGVEAGAVMAKAAPAVKLHSKVSTRGEVLARGISVSKFRKRRI